MAMSTPEHDPGDVVTAIMLQITQHAERLALLDQREAGHLRDITVRLDELARHLAEERVDAVHDLAAKQAALLKTLDGLDQQVAALTVQLADMTAAGNSNEGAAYKPAPAPRWWNLDGAERDEASTGCAPGSSRSTAPATATSPPVSAPAGTSTRSACTAWTGSWNSGQPCTSAQNARLLASPARPNGKPGSSPPSLNNSTRKPPAANTTD
jgi:hypothetical protein